MGGVEFRVKRVPDPVPYVGRVESGGINRDELLVSSVIPRMPRDLDFELNFIIQSLNFVSTSSAIFIKDINGNQFTERLRYLSVRHRSGQKIWIESM